MMVLEWIRFALAAAILIFALVCFAAAVKGVWKFGFVMNRMHAAGIGDTLGLLSVILALMLASGWNMGTLKLLLLALFLWFTSPVSSHFLSQIEYFTNPGLYRETHREETAEDAEREETAGYRKTDGSGSCPDPGETGEGSDREISDGDASGGEVSDREFSDREFSDREVSEWKH